MRKALAFLLLIIVVSACGWNDERNEERGRGDAPVGWVDDTPKNVIQMPDQFSNVAHACDGHGHRVFVTTQNENGKAMFVIADPTCEGPDNEGETHWSGQDSEGEKNSPSG